MCMSPTRAAAKNKIHPSYETLRAKQKLVVYKDDSEMRLTLVSPGIIQVVENGNQNIKHITALQDKKQEFLWKKHNKDFV